MIHKTLLLPLALIVGLLLPKAGYAQLSYNQTTEYLKANGIWAFYEKQGLNFNNRANFQFDTELSGLGANKGIGCASVADPLTGELLFYSNGMQAWNKNHQLMPNGDSLIGSNKFYITAQGACIVPFIGDPTKYYLFSLNSHTQVADKNTRLYYSVINMDLENGLGNVVAGQKMQVLDSTHLGSSMIAIPGNNCDVWLIIHARDSAIFRAYHITKAGINAVPIVSRSGSQIQGITQTKGEHPRAPVINHKAYSLGQMAISPDRTKLAITSSNSAIIGFDGIYAELGRSWGSLLCKFDVATGSVSDAVLIDTMAGAGVAFSPDNNKLYVFSSNNYINDGNIDNQRYHVVQFDVKTNDSATIARSRFNFPANNYRYSGNTSLKLYHDTVYIAAHSQLFSLGAPYAQAVIDRISKPNLTGTAATYDTTVIDLKSTSYFGLPSDVVYPVLDTQAIRQMDTLICKNWSEGQQLIPSAKARWGVYNWSNATSDSTLIIFSKGTYWVQYQDIEGCLFIVDTFVLDGEDLIKPEINININELGTAIPYNSYQWMMNGNPIPNETAAKLNITVNGEYQVIVTNEYGCQDTSSIYKVSTLAMDQIKNFGARIQIYPNPVKDVLFIQATLPVNAAIYSIEGKKLIQVEDQDKVLIQSLPEGIYLIHFYDKNGLLLKVDKFVK